MPRLRVGIVGSIARRGKSSTSKIGRSRYGGKRQLVKPTHGTVATRRHLKPGDKVTLGKKGPVATVISNKNNRVMTQHRSPLTGSTHNSFATHSSTRKSTNLYHHVPAKSSSSPNTSSGVPKLPKKRRLFSYKR